MGKNIYREKSLENISSPENLDNYIHVVGPGVWMILLTIILALAGFFVWASLGSIKVIDKYECEKNTDNIIQLSIEEDTALSLETDTVVYIDDIECEILSKKKDDENEGKYSIKVDASGVDKGTHTAQIFREIKPIKYIFN